MFQLRGVVRVEVQTDSNTTTHQTRIIMLLHNKISSWGIDHIRCTLEFRISRELTTPKCVSRLCKVNHDLAQQAQSRDSTLWTRDMVFQQSIELPSPTTLRRTLEQEPQLHQRNTHQFLHGCLVDSSLETIKNKTTSSRNLKTLIQTYRVKMTLAMWGKNPCKKEHSYMAGKTS